MLPGDSTRGVIRNLQRAMQHVDYSGLRWNSITPTNIDGLLDFSGRLFVFLEFKGQGAPLPLGQRIALRNIHRAITKGGAVCVVLLAEHYAADPAVAIQASTAVVIEILDGANWRQPLRLVTVREAVDTYLRRTFPEAA